MRRAMLVAVVLSGLPVGGAAADVWDGNTLLDQCEYWPTGGAPSGINAFKTGACVGYIWGAAYALNGTSYCLSQGVQPNQIVDVIKLWLDGHPEVRHFTASSLVAAALKEKFPCN